MNIDLLIHNAHQLVTCASPNEPKRGAAMRELGLIADGAVAIHQGRIIDVGPSSELMGRYTANEMLDARGKAACPGFVDCHTHVVYAGDRIAEFEQRIGGATYLEIMAAGGGIASTTRATRAAPIEQLVAETRTRLDDMFVLGTTTVEVKTGYGLDEASELKMLQAIEQLDQTHSISLVPTFLGAHAIPPEFAGRADDYVQLVVEQMIPHVAAWYRHSHFAPQNTPLFVDIFCEDHAFTVAHASQVLRAGRECGMQIKAHVDQFNRLGGLDLALQLGATSVDHLDATDEAGIAVLAASEAVGVLIPAATFNLGGMHFANARAMIDAGAAIALTTDMNPGSAPCPSLPLVTAIACRYQRMLPAEALNAITINAANALGLGKRIGSLEPGKDADLLVLDTPDYRTIMYEFGGNHIETVIKRGVVAKVGRP
jgi:imidazolonepropionase